MRHGLHPALLRLVVVSFCAAVTSGAAVTTAMAPFAVA